MKDKKQILNNKKKHEIKPFNKRHDLYQCVNCGDLHLNITDFKRTKCL